MQLLLRVALFIRDEESFKYDLTPTDVAIIFLIASHLGVKEFWFISQDEIAKECRIKSRHFRDRSIYIAEQGLLEIKRTGKANGYKIILPYVEGKIWCSDRHHSAELKDDVTIGDRHHSAGLIGTTVPNRSAPQCLHNINNKENNKKTKKTKRKKRVSLPVVLPDWLDKQLWESFVQFRKDMKAPMKEHAQNLAIGRLEKFKAEGHNPEEIINASIMNGWKGLFAPKKDFKHQSNQGNSGYQRQEIKSTVPEYRTERQVITPEQKEKNDKAQELAMNNIRKFLPSIRRK